MRDLSNGDMLSLGASGNGVGSGVGGSSAGSVALRHGARAQRWVHTRPEVRTGIIHKSRHNT